MKFTSILKKDFIHLGGSAQSKEEAMKHILHAFEKNTRFKANKERIYESLKEREKAGSTLLDSGILLPHAKIENFDESLVGIYVPQSPIKDKAGAEIAMIILIVTAKEQPKDYLNILAAIGRMGQSVNSEGTALLKELKLSTEVSDFLQHLDDHSIVLTDYLRVSDIMTTEVIAINENKTLNDLADIFYNTKLSYVPVVNDAGELVGELNVLSLIEQGIPEFAKSLGSLSFLKSFTPLERFFEVQEQLFVKDMMKKVVHSFDKDSSLAEAVFIFSENKKRHMTVVEGKQILGVVSVRDILNKILRG